MLQVLSGDQAARVCADAGVPGERFPSVTNGLNEVETAALAVLRRGPRRFGELFRNVSGAPLWRWDGARGRLVAAPP
jgi:hypothetical protein